MASDVLGDLLRALDAVVTERQPTDHFLLITPPPDWFPQVVRGAAIDEPFRLEGILPFLDTFLYEADAFWRAGREGVLASPLFAAAVENQDDLLLRASALTLGQRQLLVLHRLVGVADTRPLLQQAREDRLAHEQLVKRIGTLHGAAKALARVAARLRETEPTPAQRTAVDEIDHAVARLGQVLEGVPEPPRYRRG
jgi:hypothetical protein